MNTSDQREMSKIFILSCLCLVILYVNYAVAQNQQNGSVKPARMPPARVLNSVEPKGRERQDQKQIRQRQMSKKLLTHGKVNPAQILSISRCMVH